MRRRDFFALALANLASLLFTGCGREPEQPPTNAASTGVAQEASTEASEVLAYEQQNRAQLAAARQRQAQADRLAAAVAKTKEFRSLVQSSKGKAWSAFVDPRRPTFRLLRRQAAQSPTQTVPCTICDGRGELSFCLVCDNSGKCPTCNGTGTELTHELCPTCQGKGKCFLCFGTGRMPCPFCDDGTVYAQQPSPPQLLPIG